jgi:Zn-dependent protease
MTSPLTATLTPITTYITQHAFDFTLLAVFVCILILFLYKNKHAIVVQKIIAFGGFNVLSMVLVKTTWGLKLMDSVSKKFRAWVLLFGYVSIGLGFIGIVLNIFLLATIVVQLFQAPTVSQVSLVLPFTEVPGIGFLSFTHWIIAIFVLATVHEFAHGVVGRAHAIKIKSSGIASLSLFGIPLIPAAFVEQDEKSMEQKSDVAQYAMLTAGPLSNIFLAIPLGLIYLALISTASPLYQSQITHTGFTFASINETSPAGLALLPANVTYIQVDGVAVTDATYFLKQFDDRKKPQDTIALTYLQENTPITNVVTLGEHPVNNTKPYLGVVGIRNVYEYNYPPVQPIYEWFATLFKWLFMFNLLIGLMNLMPLYITDGGQLVRIFLQKNFSKSTALKWYTYICGTSFWILIIALLAPTIIRLFLS